jgi:hypothetical protein
LRVGTGGGAKAAKKQSQSMWSPAPVAAGSGGDVDAVAFEVGDELAERSAQRWWFGVDGGAVGVVPVEVT